MIFDLVRDFAGVLAAMPAAHPRRRSIELLHEALQRDRQFITRHPTALFQCLWNSCWWYDAPAAARHEVGGPGDRGASAPAGENVRLYPLLEGWERQRRQTAATPWVRSLRPPADALGTALRAVFQNHKAMVNCVAFSPDGVSLAAGSGDKDELDHCVRVVEMASGVERATYAGKFGAIHALAYSPDGRLLAFGTYGETLRVWDTETNQERWCRNDHHARVTGVAFHPDGRRLVSCGGGAWFGKDDTIRIWDALTGEPLQCLRGHDRAVTCVAITSDGRHIVSGSNDRTARVWEVASGREVRRLEHDSFVLCLAISPDGARIAVGTFGGQLFVWDASDGRLLHTLTGHRDDINGVTFLGDHTTVATASSDTSIRLWHIDRQASHIVGEHQAEVAGLAYSPTLGLLASASGDRTIRLWDIRHSRTPRRMMDAGMFITAACFAPSQDFLATATGKESRVVLWRLPEGVPFATGVGHRKQVRCLAVAANGTVASGGDDHTIRLWRRLGPSFLSGHVREGHTGPVTTLAFSADSQLLVSGSVDTTVRLWDVRRGREPIRTFEGHARPVREVRFSTDDRRVIVRDDDGWRQWDVATGEGSRLEPAAAGRSPSEQRYACRAVDYWALETPILEERSGQPVAWIPSPLLHVESHPLLPFWWGRPEHGDYSWIVRLEDADPDTD